jgi:hypothetical protein
MLAETSWPEAVVTIASGIGGLILFLFLFTDFDLADIVRAWRGEKHCCHCKKEENGDDT